MVCGRLTSVEVVQITGLLPFLWEGEHGKVNQSYVPLPPWA